MACVYDVLSKVELREERVPGIVADVETSLERVLAVRPGQVIDVLIALLQPALGTAEISSCRGAIVMDNARGTEQLSDVEVTNR